MAFQHSHSRAFVGQRLAAGQAGILGRRLVFRFGGCNGAIEGKDASSETRRSRLKMDDRRSSGFPFKPPFLLAGFRKFTRSAFDIS